MVLAHIKLLGEMAVMNRDMAPIDIRLRKVKALLAVLALYPDQRHGREGLASLLWGGRRDEQARRSLNQNLSALRKSFGSDAKGIISSDHQAVWLNPKAIAVDATALRGFASNCGECEREEALALCDGNFLDGFALKDPAFDDWLTVERAAVCRMQKSILTNLAEERLSHNDAGAAVAPAERLVALDPLNEGAHRLLMRALAQAGQRNAALAHFRKCCDLLNRELGVEPETETRLVFEALRSAMDQEQAPLNNQPHGTKAVVADRPTIAVLPFTNLSGDPEESYFSDGMAEDLITELSRFKSLQVVARNSTFVYRDQAVNVQHAGQALGASYVLEGSLRKAGKQLRLTAQLIDVETNMHIWAERYDRKLVDIFEVQDELVHAIVTKLAGRLAVAETERSRRKRPESLTAHDFYLRGLQGFRQYNKESVLAAAEILEKAVALDPNHAKAQALLGWSISVSAWWTSLGDYEPHTNRALALARRAIEIEPDESFCLMLLGYIHIHRQELEQAQHHFGRALALNPHDLFARACYATYLLYKGKPHQALEQLDELKDTEPFPPNWCLEARGMSLYGMGQFEDAIAAFRQMTTLNYWNYGYLSACYGQLGERGEAQAHWTQMADAIPDPMLRVHEDMVYFENQVDVERWLEGLRKAGVLT